MKLTKAEKAWVAKVNESLSECPSSRMRFFTIGDSSIYIANNDTADDWDLDDTDTLISAERKGHVAYEQIVFPAAVEGVCG